MENGRLLVGLLLWLLGQLSFYGAWVSGLLASHLWIALTPSNKVGGVFRVPKKYMKLWKKLQSEESVKAKT